MTRRVAVIVLDGVGVGEAPDTPLYGDAGSNTLGNLARMLGGITLPNLQRAGLGNLAGIAGVPPVDRAEAAHGIMVPRSAGKDSTTGHWEIAGVQLTRPFPTYPQGFPEEIIREFARRTRRGVIGNVVASGTAILDLHGEEHQRTGDWIVYTSADSVFQVAAHEATISPAELYEACAIAREILVAPHDVSRVIARPFAGEPGAYRRTENRRDFSLAPPETTVLDALEAAGIPRAGVGKVDDLFAGRGIASQHTRDNAQGIALLHEWLAGANGGLLFANLVDFDTLYGHRNDVPGFYGALQEFDAALPKLVSQLREDDLLFITADHGNDPTTPSTDHARECVPLLAFGSRVRPASLGRRETFADLGATVGEWLGIEFRGAGTSFLPRLLGA